MNAKEYLARATRMDRRISALMERRRRYAEMALCLEPTRRAGIEALEGELGQRVESYAAIIREIEGAIDALDSARDRDVLCFRYLNGWSWQRIAAEMCLSKDRLWHLHARALEAMEAVLRERMLNVAGSRK